DRTVTGVQTCALPISPHSPRMRPPSCTRARFLHKLAYNRALHAMLMARDRSRAASPRSLKVSDAFKSFVLDQLADTGDVTSKSRSEERRVGKECETRG